MSRQSVPRVDAADLLEQLDWLAALARQLAGGSGWAEDLTQDACVIALQQAPADRSRIRRWLAQVARNLVRQRVRGEYRRRAREESQARPGSVESTGALVERVSLQRDLARLVLELDEPCRTTVLLRFYSSLPPREIARRLGVPVTTVHGRLQRGLRTLRARLDESAGSGAVWSVLLVDQTPRTTSLLSTSLGGSLVTAKLAFSAALLVAGSWLAVLAWRHLDEPVRQDDRAGRPSDHRDGEVQQSEELAGDSGAALDSARRIPSTGSMDSPVDSLAESLPEATALERSRETLVDAVEATLRGDLDASAFLDLGLALVELEVDPRAVPEASPSGEVRFPLVGTPEGLTAELHVRATSRGQTVLSLHVELDAPSSPYILEGAARQAPVLNLSPRSDESGEPSHFVVHTSSMLSGPGNRDAGIALDRGRFPLGFIAAFPMDDLMRPSVRMSSWVDDKLVPNELIDSWRLVGGPWPREADLRLFHERLWGMHASLAK